MVKLAKYKHFNPALCSKNKRGACSVPFTVIVIACHICGN